MKMCMFFFCPGAVFPTKAWTPSQRTDIGATSPGLLLFSFNYRKTVAVCSPNAKPLNLQVTRNLNIAASLCI
jgi:hypothetical protein